MKEQVSTAFKSYFLLPENKKQTGSAFSSTPSGKVQRFLSIPSFSKNVLSSRSESTKGVNERSVDYLVFQEYIFSFFYTLQRALFLSRIFAIFSLRPVYINVVGTFSSSLWCSDYWKMLLQLKIYNRDFTHALLRYNSPPSSYHNPLGKLFTPLGSIFENWFSSNRKGEGWN